MKISKADFESMKAKYSQEVKKGNPGKSKKGDVTNQTDWVFFDRETLEKILLEADKDPKKGGIRFFITEYSKETAEKFYPENPDDYVGRITLVLEASTLESPSQITIDETTNYYNRGELCPPKCEIKLG
jgi:hypothetical protein